MAKATPKSNIALFRETVRSAKDKIVGHLGDQRLYDPFIREAELVFMQKPELQTCEIDTVMRALYDCARTQLRISGKQPHAYLIKRGTSCCFDVSYHGYLHLGRRCGAINHMKVGDIRDGDQAIWKETENGDVLEVTKIVGNNNPVIAYYARFWLPNGMQLVEMMTRQEVEAHRKQYSQASGPNSPWSTSFDAMAKKTVIRQAFLRGSIPLDDATRRILMSDVIDGQVVTEAASEPQTGPDEAVVAEIEQHGMDEAGVKPSPGQRELALKGDLDA